MIEVSVLFGQFALASSDVSMVVAVGGATG